MQRSGAAFLEWQTLWGLGHWLEGNVDLAMVLELAGGPQVVQHVGWRQLVEAAQAE